MASLRIQQLEKQLRTRLGRFVAVDSKRHYPHIYSLLKVIRNNNYPAFLCGGAVRNMLLCNNSIPRDLDIIFGYVSKKQLGALFPSYVKGKTNLGGLKLQVKDWSIDMWPIQETWAFKEGKVTGKGFSDYPKITFLNVDAIAIQLFSKRRQKREIYSKGFFEAITEKTIELNFEENPAPAECIVRALRIANQFKFVIGPRLARYMISYANKTEIEELADIYQRRYMSADVTLEKLYNCFKSIKTQMQASNNKPVKVFVEQNSDFLEQLPGLPKSNRDLFAMT
ncbi:MAG: hypothetical protein PVJ60_05915 [Phycisphaerales bacterium]|jgi:hypothetical protein